MKVSIITINYNNRDGLEKTVRSVISQNPSLYEYIIIDGGSTDGSVDVIKKFACYITYWVSEKDRGIYHAMNKGIEAGKGDYYNFLNSGDCYHDKDVLDKFNKYLHRGGGIYTLVMQSMWTAYIKGGGNGVLRDTFQ